MKFRFSLRTLLAAILFLNCAILLWSHRHPWRVFHVLNGHLEPVRFASFSPDGLKVITADDGGCALEWEVSTGKLLHKCSAQKGQLFEPAWSCDGARFLTPSLDTSVCIWDSATGSLLFKLEHPDYVTMACFFPRQPMIATYCLGTEASPGSPESEAKVYIWDGNTGKYIQSWEVVRLHNTRWGISNLQISIDEKRIITQHANDERQWEISSGKELISERRTVPSRLRRYFPRNGFELFTSDNTDFEIHDKAGQVVFRAFAHEAGPRGGLIGSAFSPDGTTFITCGMDKIAKIWKQYRPVYWYGIFALVEFWLTFLTFAGFAWSIFIDQKNKSAETQANTMGGARY